MDKNFNTSYAKANRVLGQLASLLTHRKATLLSRGKPIGRSSSLNYGSGNPVKSTAGKVPWVRLKRKDSLTLSDIVNGSTPQSPNTVKLAVPEPRFLPAAPNFKTTPLIVTTEHSRARVVDTQAVVSALREKRKRFGGGQREDSFSEDSWINAAKRRRQDSSQSNASSVSIPSMPESLPDLMGTPGVSLLHIENLKDQRPSTVPAMDAFVSRHQREFGLGGDLLGQSPQLQVYNQAQHQEVSGGLNKQNSKSVLRSVQSSLSSSLRARTNLAMLQNNGPDLTRIRQVPEGYETPRRMSVNFDESARDHSSTDAQLKALIPTTINTASDKTTSSLADKSTPGGSVAKSATPLSIQRQKIADGVVLKKHNLSINSTSTPVKSKQMQPLNILISTNDIEQDRQKEYKRRVLDLLDEDEPVERPGKLRQDSSQSNASSVSIPSMPESLPDLMGTPGVSLLHIENLKDQRPSTVPAMDAFVSRHQREFGLGGDLLGQSPQLQVYNQAQHQEVSGGLNKQNSKSVLRSVQSSLSSSLRARTNLAMLQNNGPDLTRIRQVPEGYETPRRMSVNFDESARDHSSTDAQLKALIPTTINTASDKTTSSLADKSTPGGSVAKSATPLSIQRQKIADGVVLKKHNLSINSTSTPVKSKQMQPLNILISTNDIEQDRQKEYKRRVLDLLDEDEPVERPGVSSAPSLPILAAPTTISAPAATASLGLPVGIATAALSSAATAVAVSASLDSLNKLVQSAAGSGLSLTTAGSSAVAATSSTNTLSQVLQASGDDTASSEQTQNNTGSTFPNLTFQGNALATSSAAPALNTEVSFGFIASTRPSQTASTELSTAASSSTGGLQFGASLPSTSSVGSTQSTPAATSSGFQINFSAASAPLGIASTAPASIAAAPSAVSMGSGQQSSNGGFNFSLGSTSSSQPNTGMFGAALGSQQSTNSGFNFGSFPASQTSSSMVGSAASTPVFSGMPQTTAFSSASSMNQFNGTLQNPDISFKGPSVQTVAVNTPVSLSAGGMFGSGMAQSAPSSAPLSLSSTLQAFAASQSRDESSVTRPTSSGMLGHGFAHNATPFSTAASVAPSTTSTPGMFNFGAPNTTTSLSAGFGLGSSGVGTAQHGTVQQGTATVMSSLAPATAGATPSQFGFNFGAGSSATTTAPQQPSGQQPFGVGPASSLPASSGLTSGGFPGQSSFTGFGLSTQGHSTTTAFSSGGPQSHGLFTSTGSSAPAPSQLFGSAGTSAFGSSSQASLAGQQPFGASTGLSMFGTAATTTTTAGTGLFNFGQTSAPTTTSTNTFAFAPNSTSNAFSKPFAFGAASTQPAAGFGGVTTTSNSVFGNIVSPAPSAGPASMFGGGTTFGTSSVTSPFGSSGQATSAPMFGSSGPAPSAQAFGAMVPTTSPPAFGSMVPTTAPPAFGSAINTSMFGTANSQTQSVFGSAAPSGGQPASVFGASAASSNQLFTFGAGGSSQTPSQQGSTFGSNPSGAFGSAAPAGSSMFGAKPAPPAFNAAAANPATMFGAPVQNPSSATSAFGSSFGMSNTFGAQSNADKPAFGAASSAFGTSAVSSFGAAPQNSVFGASSQNSASNLFGVAPQNPPPAFGSQPAAVQTVASSPFGGAVSSGATAFGAAKPNPFGAPTTSQANFNFAATQQMANPFNTQPANSGYNFNQQNTQPAASNAGFNFGAQTPPRPQLPAPSPGGFNFAANAAGPAPPAFNFNAAPSTPNPFTPQIPGAAPRPRAAARRATRRGGTRR